MHDHGSSMDSDARRREILRDCIGAMYWRYRVKVPDRDDLETEIDFAMQDFRKIPTYELQDMFACAYRMHDGQRIPINKQILQYWAESRPKFVAQKISVECSKCESSGLVRTYHTLHGFRYEPVFRCDCSNASQYSEKIPVYGPDWEAKGYKLINKPQGPRVRYAKGAIDPQEIKKSCWPLLMKRLNGEINAVEYAVELQSLDKKYPGLGFDQVSADILRLELEREDKLEAEKKQKEKHEPANELDANVHATA